MRLEELQHAVRGAVEDPALTYRQRVQLLASLAENILDPPPLSAAAQHALDKRVICDMYEGNAPYRPRYVLPDYAKALRQGSEFLELPPPASLDEAIAFLLAMYANVPSITGYPVYLGNFDELLASYVGELDDDALHRVVRNLWVVLDRTMPDAFTHTNIGPEDSRVARAVLRVAAELQQVVPNLTLRVDPERTPDDLVLDTWQLWSCIRFTRAPGNTRLFYRWQARRLTDRDWTPKGVALTADSCASARRKAAYRRRSC